jgi:hypothetical protein
LPYRVTNYAFHCELRCFSDRLVRGRVGRGPWHALARRGYRPTGPTCQPCPFHRPEAVADSCSCRRCHGLRGRYGPGGSRRLRPSALFGAAAVQPALDGHALGESGNNPEWLPGMVAWTLSGGFPFRRNWRTSRLSQRCEAWRGIPPLNPRSRHLGDYLGVCFSCAAGGSRVRTQAPCCSRDAIEKRAEKTCCTRHGACLTHETIRVLRLARIFPEEIMGDQPFLAAPQSPEFSTSHEEYPPALEP